MRAIAFLFLLMGAASAAAEDIPASLGRDDRVRSVDYDPKQVVRIVGHFGFSTHIRLADDEEVTNVALGDSVAWEVAPIGNHLFVKPRERSATTNMTVITSPGNRAYQFILIGSDVPRPDPTAEEMLFKVQFKYPDDDRRREQQRLAAAEEERRRQELVAAMVRNRDETERLLDAPEASPHNYDYMWAGDFELRPDAVYDDGRFTFIRFSDNRDMPAVFEELPYGQEALVNTHVEGDVIVVHRVLRKLVLRKGNYVVCLSNRSFDPRGISTPNATTSPAVERVIRGQR